MKIKNKLIVAAIMVLIMCILLNYTSFATENTEAIENSIEGNKSLIATNEENNEDKAINAEEKEENLLISNNEENSVTIKKYGITKSSTEYKLIRLSIAIITFIGIIDLSLSTLGKFDKDKRVFTFIIGMFVGLILASLGCGYYYRNCVKYVMIPNSQEVETVVTQK